MQRFLIVPILVLISSLCQGQLPSINVLHYRFQIELNDYNDSIFGRAAIRAVCLKPTGKMVLDLANINAQGKGMSIEYINWKDGRPAAFSFTADQLQISLSHEMSMGDTVDLEMGYKGIPADGLIISRNKFGHRTFFADNWPNRAHGWLPCVDDPLDKASVEFIVIAPDHYKVVSNGLLQQESPLPLNKKRTYWKEVFDLPTKVMVIGVADFAVEKLEGNDSIEVTSWSFPENKLEAVKDFSYTAAILKFFTSYIGPYPYKKLANVQSKTMYGGMENASAIFYFENAVNGLKDQEDLIAHEMAHQWFGNSLTEKSFRHLWLSEGFATYLTSLYLESRYGTEMLNQRMDEAREQVLAYSRDNDRPVIDSVSPNDQLLNAHTYQKGAWVLHMLRRQLGDTIFKAGIREFYNRFAGKNAETDDLQKIFQKLSGKDLNPFFQQWLWRAGEPQLQQTWSYSKPQQQLRISIRQLQENIFHLPLDIEIATLSGKKIIKQVFLTKRNQTFSFTVKGKVMAVKPDPHHSLLFSERSE